MPQPMASAYSSGNVGDAANNPNQLFNSISSNGLNVANPQQSAPEQTEASPAELAVQRIGGFISGFSALAENYPAANKEATDVQNSLQKWLEAVVTNLSSQGGAESGSI